MNYCVVLPVGPYATSVAEMGKIPRVKCMERKKTLYLLNLGLITANVANLTAN